MSNAMKHAKGVFLFEFLGSKVGEGVCEIGGRWRALDQTPSQNSPEKDFTEGNAFRLLRGVRLHPLPGFTQGVFMCEFELKSLIQYLWYVTSVKVRQGQMNWEKFHEDVLLKVRN